MNMQHSCYYGSAQRSARGPGRSGQPSLPVVSGISSPGSLPSSRSAPITQYSGKQDMGQKGFISYRNLAQTIATSSQMRVHAYQILVSLCNPVQPSPTLCCSLFQATQPASIIATWTSPWSCHWNPATPAEGIALLHWACA